MKHTPGNWSVGENGSVIITDTIPEDYKPGSGHDAIDYYGGFLIAESVNKRDAALIAAAPELLEALKDVVAIADRKTDEFDRARAAISKATT